MNTEEYISLVYRNLKGELSASEFDHFNRLTATDNSLAEMRLDIEDTWDVTGTEEVIVSEIDTNDLFEQIKNSKKSNDKTSSIAGKPNSGPKVIKFKNWVSSIAAILLLAVASVWLMRGDMKVYDKAGVYTLADNTIVTLRKGSTLKVRKFDESQRKVNLQGEAFFQVAKDEKLPFVVISKHIKIKVLGTSFLVKELGDETYIDLVEGKISTLNTLTLDEKIMTAGMKVKHTKDGQILPLNNFDNLSAWKDGIFQFESSTLGAVLEELSIIYNAKIDTRDQLILDCNFSGTLAGESLEELLSRIAKMYQIEVKQDGSNWMLNGGQCN